MSSTGRSLLLASLLCSLPALAAWRQVGEGTAGFRALGPAGFKIVGTSPKLEVKEEGEALLVTLRLKDLDTDNSIRNRHMLEDLQAEQFPLVTLSVPVAALKEGPGEQQATGTFTLHGKSKDLPFTYTARCEAGTCQVDGKADLNLKDFEVKVRSYLSITVKPELALTTRFTVTRAP